MFEATSYKFKSIAICSETAKGAILYVASEFVQISLRDVIKCGHH